MPKMSAKVTIGSMALALALSVSIGRAQPVSSGVLVPLSISVTGQAAPAESRPVDKQAQADDLLRRARQAMSRHDVATAAKLVGDAEALGVDYGPLHFGDTPKKAARDLERMRASGGSARPSQSATPYGGTASKATSNPFAGQDAALAPNGGAGNGVAVGNPGMARLPEATDATTKFPQMRPDPMMTGGTGGALPFGRATSNVPPLQGQEPSEAWTRALQAPPQSAGAPSVTASNQMLLSARRSLAVGDMRRASSLVDQAKAMPVARGMYDDTPENVESLLRKYGDLMTVPPDRQRSEGYRREYARLALEQAEGLLRRGDFDEAERLANQATRQQVVFGPMDAKPEHLLQRISAARRQGGQASAPGVAMSTTPPAQPGFATTTPRFDGAVVPAGGPNVMQTGGAMGVDNRAAPAVYDPATDPTRNIVANNLQMPQMPAPTAPLPGMPVETAPPNTASLAVALIEQGEASLRARDNERAMAYFRQAAMYQDQLDPVTAHRLKDRLLLLTAAQMPQARPGMADEATAKQNMLARQVEADILQEESHAKAMAGKEPKKALAMLEQTRQKVEASGLDPAMRDQLLRRLDRSLTDLRQFVDANRSRIDLDDKNNRIRDDVDRSRRVKVEIQGKLAQKIDEFNRLMEEQRYPEAEVIAKQCVELDPENPVSKQVLLQARFVRSFNNAMSIRDQKERGFVDALAGVEKSSIPWDDAKLMDFPDPRNWKSLTGRRGKWLSDQQRRRSERDIEIEQKLKTPVAFQFANQPLGQVVEQIGRIAGVNVYLDPQGMADEGATIDTPVTIKLDHEISLKSALNLILQPLRLNYIIKDEVLKITSESLRGGQLYTMTYNVADLVMPIPNFAPRQMGLDLAYSKAMGHVGFGGVTPFASPMNTAALLADAGLSNGQVSAGVLAQGGGGGRSMGGGGRGVQSGTPPGGANTPMGPGGAAGGSGADFDSLIDLITSTVKPESWDEVGGRGSIRGFETNLSLVVSQTQEVHEEIADLLEQLRRLQDLQITIEVRYITLNDKFYERIGVAFDVNFNSNYNGTQVSTGTVSGGGTTAFSPNFTGTNTATVGLSAPGMYSSDLDIQLNQARAGNSSFASSVPNLATALGGGDPYGGASIGFAILSDIEAYFFLNAAQGDVRTNVLEAPKVTLFNGQQAYVANTTQEPFVISVVPVVGDFAAAQQPVIVVLSEGTFLTVQAVVSNDRRFVRLTVVPFFSKIGNVSTFTFTGSTTSTENSSAQGNQTDVNDNTKNSNEKTNTRSGVTLQLPSYKYTTVTTTVSVPDGGTVLLGGIKKLDEERKEFGTPMLNKIPYINRLFRNTGVGRSAESLMMMVTPRIIIQEEEEQALGIQP